MVIKLRERERERDSESPDLRQRVGGAFILFYSIDMLG